MKWCSGRDSNPGPRLERPLYLTGLYYRSWGYYASATMSHFGLIRLAIGMYHCAASRSAIFLQRAHGYPHNPDVVWQ
jgi:hypothetical protein